MSIIILFVVWVITGFINYKCTFNYFQKKYSDLAEIDRINDKIFAIITSLFGPLGLIVFLVFLSLDKSGYGK